MRAGGQITGKVATLSTWSPERVLRVRSPPGALFGLRVELLLMTARESLIYKFRLLQKNEALKAFGLFPKRIGDWQISILYKVSCGDGGVLIYTLCKWWPTTGKVNTRDNDYSSGINTVESLINWISQGLPSTERQGPWNRPKSQIANRDPPPTEGFWAALTEPPVLSATEITSCWKPGCKDVCSCDSYPRRPTTEFWGYHLRNSVRALTN